MKTVCFFQRILFVVSSTKGDTIAWIIHLGVWSKNLGQISARFGWTLRIIWKIICILGKVWRSVVGVHNSSQNFTVKVSVGKPKFITHLAVELYLYIRPCDGPTGKVWTWIWQPSFGPTLQGTCHFHVAIRRTRCPNKTL
jgi:hypothetical protein